DVGFDEKRPLVEPRANPAERGKADERVVNRIGGNAPRVQRNIQRLWVLHRQLRADEIFPALDEKLHFGKLERYRNRMIRRDGGPIDPGIQQGALERGRGTALGFDALEHGTLEE